MAEEDETLDPGKIGEIASTKFKTEIERKVVTDDDGSEWEFTVETRKTMTPEREFISDKRAVVSKFMTCGHQVTDPRQIMRCTYGYGHAVCRDCIVTCEGNGELVCLNHSDEYQYEGRTYRLCQDCGQILERYQKGENTITRRAFRMIKGMLEREDS